MHPDINFSISTPVKIIFENVVFSSTQLLVPNCMEHWCAHCHDQQSNWNGWTGQSLMHITTPSGKELSKSDNLVYIPYNVGKEQQCYWEDSHLLWDSFWLFSVNNEEASLEINESKFENWRFRQLSVINIYLGQVLLTNVDFENTEASSSSMVYGPDLTVDTDFEVGLSHKIYAVPGIITATKDRYVAWKESHNGDEGISAPSGRFIWNGGSVTGHNIDMNPTLWGSEPHDRYERFSPFLNLNRLEEVQISGLNITNSFMFDTLKETPSLFTVQYCVKVIINDLNFSNNWLDSGAISLFLNHFYLPWVDYDMCDFWSDC